MVSDLRNLRNIKSFNNLMKVVVRVLKCDLSWLADLSSKQFLCWGILATCVSKIAVSNDGFEWVKNYSDIISDFELGAVYTSFCEDQGLTLQQYVITDNLPPLITMNSSNDLQR